MLSVIEWRLLSLNEILPQSISPKSEDPWVTFQARSPKVEGDDTSTDIQKGGGRLNITYACFFTLGKRKRGSTKLWFCGGLCTDSSGNECVWFLWVAGHPASKLSQFFYFQLGLWNFFSSVGRPTVLPALPPLSELWKQIFGRTAV